MPRYEVIPAKVWKHTSGHTASIYGAVPYVNPAEKPDWAIVQVGFTIRDNHDNTVGLGRAPFQSESEAIMFADRLNTEAAARAKLYEKTTVARWESKSGKHYAELVRDSFGYSYRGRDCGGNLGNITDSEAFAEMTKRVDQGYFQPDSLKTPMKRVA